MTFIQITEKPVLFSDHSKIDKTKVLKTIGSLMSHKKDAGLKLVKNQSWPV